jgi:hypothetical protein
VHPRTISGLPELETALEEVLTYPNSYL